MASAPSAPSTCSTAASCRHSSSNRRSDKTSRAGEGFAIMIGHYLRSALAKFRKTPFTTGANVLTLALGLSCFIAAWGVASWWASADHYHRGAERTFVVGQTNRIDRGDPDQERQPPASFDMSSWNLAPHL